MVLLFIKLSLLMLCVCAMAGLHLIYHYTAFMAKLIPFLMLCAALMVVLNTNICHNDAHDLTVKLLYLRSVMMFRLKSTSSP